VAETSSHGEEKDVRRLAEERGVANLREKIMLHENSAKMQNVWTDALYSIPERVSF